MPPADKAEAEVLKSNVAIVLSVPSSMSEEHLRVLEDYGSAISSHGAMRVNCHTPTHDFL